MWGVSRGMHSMLIGYVWGFWWGVCPMGPMGAVWAVGLGSRSGRAGASGRATASTSNHSRAGADPAPSGSPSSIALPVS